MIGAERGQSRDTSKTGMFRPPPCRSLLLRSLASSRPVFSHGRRFYAQVKVDRAAEDFNNLSTEEQLERLAKLNASASNNPNWDLWSLSTDLLDLHVPEPVIRTRTTPLSFGTRVNNFFANQANHFKNVFSMYRLAKTGSLPGVDTSKALRPGIFTVNSTSDASWVAPLRGIAVTTYNQVYRALADGDVKTIKNFTTNPYTSHLQTLLKSRTSPNQRFKWTSHSEVTPPQIVSIRAIEGHLGRGGPKLGNRLVIQALIRFDTMQTLEIYSKQGNLLSPKESSTPRRVTEYLVFEKRMWYDVPWKIRQQMFERSG